MPMCTDLFMCPLSSRIACNPHDCSAPKPIAARSSSISSPWPKMPFTSAACSTPVRRSVPSTVATGEAPWRRAYSIAILPCGNCEQASWQAMASRTTSFAFRTTAAGRSSNRKPVTCSATIAVRPCGCVMRVPSGRGGAGSLARAGQHTLDDVALDPQVDKDQRHDREQREGRLLRQVRQIEILQRVELEGQRPALRTGREHEGKLELVPCLPEREHSDRDERRERQQQQDVPPPEPPPGERVGGRDGEQQGQCDRAEPEDDAVEQGGAEPRPGQHLPIGLEGRVRRPERWIGE